MVEDIEDLAVIAERQNEKEVPFSDFEDELKKRGNIKVPCEKGGQFSNRHVVTFFQKNRQGRPLQPRLCNRRCYHFPGQNSFPEKNLSNFLNLFLHVFSPCIIGYEIPCVKCSEGKVWIFQIQPRYLSGSWQNENHPLGHES